MRPLTRLDGGFAGFMDCHTLFCFLNIFLENYSKFLRGPTSALF